MPRVRAKIAIGVVAMCMLASSAFAQTQEAVAKERFDKGRTLFLDGRYAPALAEFRAASELFESPNTHLYIARCERALGHVGAAYVEFQRAASEAADRAASDPRYVSTRDVATQEGKALEGKIARVKIVAKEALPPGTTITLNGADVGSAAVGVAAPVDPGPVEVVAKAPGYATLRRTAHAAAGESVEIPLALQKESGGTATSTSTSTSTSASTTSTSTGTSTDTGDGGTTTSGGPEQLPQASHGLRNAGFVVGALGIAGMGAFATFAALAQTRYDQLKAQCGAGPCDPSLSASIDEGQTFQNVADVALAASATALVTGAIMIIAGVSTEHKSNVTASLVPLPGGGFVAGFGRAF